MDGNIKIRRNDINKLKEPVQNVIQELVNVLIDFIEGKNMRKIVFAIAI